MDFESLIAERRAGGGNASGDSFTELVHQRRTRQVERTLDADTADLSLGEWRTPTRFAGIDAPEMGQGEFGIAAQIHLKKLLKEHAPDGKVRTDLPSVDPYGRNVSFLYAGDKNVNVELVRAGHAKPAYLESVPEDIRKQLVDAQEEAKRAQIGIWTPGVDFEDAKDWRGKKGAQGAYEGHMQDPLVNPDSYTIADLVRQRRGKLDKINFTRDLGNTNRGKSNSWTDGLLPKVKRDDQYPDSEGWLDRVANALDYTGNVSRSFLKGAVEGFKKSPWQVLPTAQIYAGQAMLKKRQTTATNLKDTYSRLVGLGKIRMGKDDGEFDVGDVGDFAADVAIDIFTDPLTYLSFGLSKLAQGGTAMAKSFPKVHKALIDTKLGVKSVEALKWGRFKTGTQAAIGAAYGVGALDDDATTLQKLSAGAGGALVGAKIEPALKGIGKFSKGVFDSASSKYAIASRGKPFTDLPVQRSIWLRSQDKVRNIAQTIVQGRYNALDGLDAAGKVKVTKIMGDLKGEFLRRRHLEEGKRTWLTKKHPKYENEMQKINRFVYEQMVRQGVVEDLVRKESAEVGQAVRYWIQNNNEIIMTLNKSRFGVSEFDPKTGKGIFGIPFHMDDLYKKGDIDLDSVDDALGKFKIYKADRLSRSNEPLIEAVKEYKKQTGKYLDVKTLQKHVDNGDEWAVELYSKARDKSYEVYANQFARNFLDDIEQKSWDFMKQYSDAPAKGSFGKLENILQGFDKTTNWMKANMLFFSSSWLKNNYFDNMAKSLVENGFQGVVDAATLGKMRKGLNRDVWQLYSHKGMQRAFTKGMRKDLEEALAGGVLDNPMYKALLDRDNPLLYRPGQIKEAAEESTKPLKILERAGNRWLSSKPLEMVSRVGTQMEGTARFMTYQRVRDAMLESPVIKSMGEEGKQRAREYASKVVSDTFFDYGNVTHFENAVFKRLVPFYSFYSKNMPYWINAMFDPEKVGRLITLEKARTNVGSTPTDYDKKGMSKYLTQNAARKLGTDKDGRKRYAIFPSGSMYDAIRQANPLMAGEEMIAKGHPLLKMPYELATGHDLFDDSELYPSRTKDRKKFLFSRGHKYRMLPGVEVDKQGNPYATHNGIVTLDKIVSTLWPHGFVDQVAGSVGKVHSGKETVPEALFNRAGPGQIAKVSKAYERMIRQQKSKEK